GQKLPSASVTKSASASANGLELGCENPPLTHRAKTGQRYKPGANVSQALGRTYASADCASPQSRLIAGPTVYSGEGCLRSGAKRLHVCKLWPNLAGGGGWGGCAAEGRCGVGR